MYFVSYKFQAKQLQTYSILRLGRFRTSDFEILLPSLNMALSTLIHAVDDLVTTCIPQKMNASNRDSRRRQRCVTFAAEEEIYGIPHVEELSVDECQTLYYSEKDYRRIEQENNQTLRLMEKRQFPGTDKLYFRGLEGQLPNAQHESLLLALEALLQEQKFGIMHPYWVNHIHCAFAVDATHVAHLMGVWDAEAVKAEEVAPAVIQDKPQAGNCQ